MRAPNRTIISGYGSWGKQKLSSGDMGFFPPWQPLIELDQPDCKRLGPIFELVCLVLHEFKVSRFFSIVNGAMKKRFNSLNPAAWSGMRIGFFKSLQSSMMK